MGVLGCFGKATGRAGWVSLHSPSSTTHPTHTMVRAHIIRRYRVPPGGRVVFEAGFEPVACTLPSRGWAPDALDQSAIPPGKAIHAILDNVVTHKHPKVRAWLAHHPRWAFHFAPTSASWLNAVERFFSALTRRRLRRSSFTGVIVLHAAIKRYIAEQNRSAKPFVWTKPSTDILAAVSRSPEPSV
ncbi:hypothetical protein MFUR16E_00365 [Methylobacterium fujisawaense]